MYEAFFGLTKNPFSLTPDPRFLLMTQAHGNVQAGLVYAIRTGKGFAVLTGEAGTGKSTLLRSAINSIPPEKLCFSLITNPALTPEDFYETALHDFGLPKGNSKPERLRNLQNYLLDVHAAGKSAVLFVDEAHRLSVETLEEIRLLTNFETETKKLLQIVLAGQDELGAMLDLAGMRQLKQRVEVRLEIGPLLPGEIWMYIRHRWNCVGKFEAPFSPEAVRLIGQFSGGIPRLINSVCDNALLIAFAESERSITAQHVLEAGRDLHLSPPGEAATRSPLAGPVETKQDPPPGPMGLHIPPPISPGFGEKPSSLFASADEKRSWWWPRLRTPKAEIV